MQRNCKLFSAIIISTLISFGAFSQEEVEYKDVLLDGKPAKLNVVTGEITLVKLMVDSKDGTSLLVEESVEASDFHIVKENETLLDISKKYNVSLTELKRANNLETTLIDKGQRLRVKNSDAQIDSATQEVVNTTEYNYSARNNSNFHIVEKNNTLYSLAKRYNMSVDKLKSLNNLKSNLIYVGQKLQIRDVNMSDVVPEVIVWTVSKGDTLFSIAKKNGTSVDAIKQLNGLTSNLILVGQKLKLK